MVHLRLAIALWAKYARLVETDQDRNLAVAAYAAALGTAGEYAEAARLLRVVLDANTRARGPEHCQTLNCASNLAASLLQLREYAKAAVLLRVTLAARTRTVGVDDSRTLTTEGNLAAVLSRL